MTLTQNRSSGTAPMERFSSIGEDYNSRWRANSSTEWLPIHENQTEDYDNGEDLEMVEEILGIVVPVLFSVIAVVGLIGNALVVVVVLCNRQMRSTTNILIINLAVADLLFIVFCVPFTAWDYTLTYWPFGDTWCRVVQYLVIVCACASIYTLVLMSVDRYLAVVHAVRSMSIRTQANAFRSIMLAWVVIFVACVPALFSHGVVFIDDLHSFCTFRVDEGYSLAAFHITFCMVGFVVPLALIFALYALMLKRLWLSVPPGGRVSAENTRAKRRVTRLVIVVVLVFAVCWCPVHVVLVLKSVDLYGRRMDAPRIVVQITSQVLAYINSCVNPFLYAFLSESFRKGFRKVFFCKRKASRGILPACDVLRASSRALDEDRTDPKARNL